MPTQHSVQITDWQKFFFEYDLLVSGIGLNENCTDGKSDMGKFSVFRVSTQGDTNNHFY